MDKVRIGVIGCGMISEIYMQNIVNRFGNLEVIACADINSAASEKRAEQFGCKSCTVEELLQMPEIEVVLNLTIPNEHCKVSMAALKAGKHVYTEKPLATDLREGERLLAFAKEKGLLVGNAPDCFLGGGLQTCRKLIDEGVIGQPFAAQAFMVQRGPEWFHPNPRFFYQEGAGPLLDMGPYYISALVSLFGPVSRVVGAGKKPTPTRTALAAASPYRGEAFPVEVDTYITSILQFESGFTATLTVSFDGQYPYWEADLPFIRIYGTKGYMDVPDTNRYEGPVRIRLNDGEAAEYPLEFGFTENSRGMGLSDMANALRHPGTEYRANGEFGLHVADVLLSIEASAKTFIPVSIRNRCRRPDALPQGMPDEMYK